MGVGGTGTIATLCDNKARDQESHMYGITAQEGAYRNRLTIGTRNASNEEAAMIVFDFTH
jgi:hypothetical protein